MTTIRTLAEKLNLSTATVSRVLNARQSVSVSEKTRRRVLQAAEELGYRPNAAARALATGKTHTIGVLAYAMYPAHYSQTLQFMRQFTSADQFHLNILETTNQINSPEDVHRVLSWPVDGVIAFDSPVYVEAMVSKTMPIVCVGSAVSRSVDAVHVNTYYGAIDAMQHLLACGRKRIAYVHTGLGQPGECRYQAYVEQMQQAGLPTEIIHCPAASAAVDRRSVRRDIVEYVRTRGCPQALFCFTDEAAIGAMRGLCDLGIRAPKDVLIVGCDGIEDTAYHDPAISTIDMPMEEACRLAWQMMKERLAGCEEPPRYVELREKLIIRESSRVDAG